MKKLLLLILLLPSLLFAQGPCVNTLININLDQYPSETTWDIQDTLGNVIISGGPYANVPNYQPQFINNCLPFGELTFTIYDLWGDGLEGSLWGGQDGSYYIIQCGDTLVYGDDPAFGYDTTHTFISAPCPPPPTVLGCMDDDYLEYNPLANVSDSSCSTLVVYGCTDSTMYNYDSLANVMEDVDQCTYDLILHDLIGNGWVFGTVLEIYQDADTTAFFMNNGGFNQAFTIDLFAPSEVNARLVISQQAQFTAVECGFTLIAPNGDTVLSVQPPFIQSFFVYEGNTDCGNVCEEKIYGCLDTLAFNYIDSANTSDDCFYYPGCISPAYLEYHVDTANAYYTDINIQDSCETLAMFGCTDSLAFNYDSLANVDNGGCLPVVTGCMQPVAFNYNPLANVPDTCIPVIFGCTNVTALNYDSLANTDDGSCAVAGCTDPTAINYNPLATTENGTCQYVTDGTYINTNSTTTHTDNSYLNNPTAQNLTTAGSILMRTSGEAYVGPYHTTTYNTSGTTLRQIYVAGISASSRPNTFVDGRNMIFLTFVGVFAKQRDINIIMTGVSQSDFSGYPDCRDVFIKSLNTTLNLAMDYTFVLETPLMWLDKAETWNMANELGALDIIKNTLRL